MNEHIDDIKKELEEVRKLKEELKKEVKDIKDQKREEQIKGESRRLHREEARRHRAEPRRVRMPRPPQPPRLARVDLDLEGLTDSLETMMDGLGHQIEMSLRNVEGLKVPGIRVRKGRRRTKSRKEQRRKIESIDPERVAKIVAPLGNEERLRILDYLKTGGKSFNDIENFSGKTGSSLTHHLNPLIDAGYVVKGEVRGTYYVTVEGRLAYRLAQWLTHRVEKQREKTGNNGNGDSEVDIEFDDEKDTTVIETEDLEKAAEHLEEMAEELEDAKDDLEDHKEELEEAREELEESLAEEIEEEEEDLDELDWKD